MGIIYNHGKMLTHSCLASLVDVKTECLIWPISKFILEGLWCISDLERVDALSNVEINPTPFAKASLLSPKHMLVLLKVQPQPFFDLKMRLLLTLALALILGFAAAQDNETSTTNPLAVYPACAVRTNSEFVAELFRMRPGH